MICVGDYGNLDLILECLWDKELKWIFLKKKRKKEKKKKRKKKEKKNDVFENLSHSLKGSKKIIIKDHLKKI